MSGLSDTTSEQERRLLGGGLPDSAERRLAELGSDGLSSSFFSAAGFAVAVSGGIEAVGQVVGASSCRLAVGVIRRTRGPSGRLPIGSPVWREHDGPIRSWTTARQRALSRLAKQAAILGADAVLGVGARYGVRGGSEAAAVEVVLTGTAVRTGGDPRAKSSVAVFALVSPQQFCLLRDAGVEVVGIAGSCSSVQVSMAASTRRAMGGRWSGSINQELEDLTAGVYEARRLAVERLRADASRLHASGVIGVDLSRSLAVHDAKHEAGALTVHLLGTAIRGRPDTRLGLGPALSLGGQLDA